MTEIPNIPAHVRGRYGSTASLPVWLPYTQMKTAPLPLEVMRAAGALLYTADGREVVDAISSWWVTLHGHCHSHILHRLAEQLPKLDQVILAGCVHEPALSLAERLLPHLPGRQSRMFYSDNGSTAIEVAQKMALQYWQNRAEPRTCFMALEGGYHGETFGAMSLGGSNSPFSAPFKSGLFPVLQVPTPIEGREQDAVQALDLLLERHRPAAFFYEPLLQCVGGMRRYSPPGFDTMLTLLKEKEILLVADEVAVGFGRTGRWFGSDHFAIKPDIVCLSKGLTGGVLPLGVTAVAEDIFQLFLHEERSRMLLHGHSFCGNPLSCTAALASLDLMERPETWTNIARIEQQHTKYVSRLAGNLQVHNPRVIGTVLAFDLEAGEGSGYYHDIQRKLYPEIVKRDVLLRFLGNVLYVLPPYCITDAQLSRIYGVIDECLALL